MIKVGITGQSGFIGTHLYNALGLYPEEFERIPFEDDYFKDEKKLNGFVATCDTIIHLAALNRHNDPRIIYDTNIQLVKQLIIACEATKSIPHILFSSSTQEENGTLYGRSKMEGRELFGKWAEKNGGSFTGFVIPNVFGPFGNPYYNSVVATFCHQLTHNEQPKIDADKEVKLIYVGELVEALVGKIKDKSIKTKVKQGEGEEVRGRQGAKATKFREVEGGEVEICRIEHTSEIKVSEILALLEGYKENYFEKGVFPNLSNRFELNLFNTFVSYIDHASFYPFTLKLNTDERGSFVETVKFNSGGQVSFSNTASGVTRGNHFHTRKVERFAVIKGKARIEIRRIGTDRVISFDLDGKKPSFVDMPVWYTHNIKNTGKEELYTMIWINEHYNKDDADTFFEEV